MCDDPFIDPPYPAPYLAGIPSLPDRVLAALVTNPDELPLELAPLAEIWLNSLAFHGRIIAARKAWQRANGVQIREEPPWES